MNTIEQDYVIHAPVDKVWQALTDAATMEQWGATPAVSDLREGGTFSLWGGDIHGTYTKVVPNELIEQDWYEHDYPDRLHKVTYTLKPVDDGTALHLHQTEVGDDELKSMGEGWPDYYFDPIKKLLEQ